MQVINISPLELSCIFSAFLFSEKNLLYNFNQNNFHLNKVQLHCHLEMQMSFLEKFNEQKYTEIVGECLFETGLFKVLNYLDIKP